MATVEKLKSGKWRARAFVTVNGKGIRRSFTASSKKEAELLALEFVNGRKGTVGIARSFKSCAETYIEVRRNVLSPATIIGYEKMLRNNCTDVAERDVNRITDKDVQRWINHISKDLSPKSIKNIYGFFASVMKQENRTFNVRLPQKQPTEMYIPSESDINALLNVTDGELRTAIMLGAFAGLRRGEVCALTLEDVYTDSKTIRVNKSMGLNEDRAWSIKVPKTPESNRTVPVPTRLLEELSKYDGAIFTTLHPDRITELFADAARKVGLKDCHFHCLRHFWVSYLHSRGVPDVMIQKWGGWTPGSKTMQIIYRNVISDEESRISETARLILDSL